MISENTVRLKGRVYRYEVRHSTKGKQICTFGLQFYNGKDKDGKSQYFFASCKGFGTDFKLKDKQDVIVNGKLAGDTWKDKEGKSADKLYIIVDSIEEPTEQPKQETGFEFGWEAKEQDDAIPF